MLDYIGSARNASPPTARARHVPVD